MFKLFEYLFGCKSIPHFPDPLEDNDRMYEECLKLQNEYGWSDEERICHFEKMVDERIEEVDQIYNLIYRS